MAGRISYTVYRPKNWSVSLRDRIAAALDKYWKEAGGKPAAIVVNPREVENARQIVSDMGLNIDVKAVGGCLVPEVWLMMGETFVHEETA